MVKKKERGTPKRGARKPVKKSQALVKRAASTLAKRIEVLPPAEPEGRTLTEGIALGALGLVEVKLTSAEELILNEPVPESLIQIKPTGQPYLSHPGYTRWFNRAFGRMGWALVPAGKPALSGKSVVCPYVLHIHGQPAAFAMGEQEYHENNREQTYGDALEATVASALRRCAKRLGVGLELWDRAWLNTFMRQHAIRVRVNQAKRGQSEDIKWLWRLKTDAPFWNEVRGGQGGRQRDEEEPGAYTPPQSHAPQDETPVSHNPASGEKITDKQRQRLWVIVRNSGRDEEGVKAWLKSRFKVDSSKSLTRAQYDVVCRAIEATGDLK